MSSWLAFSAEVREALDSGRPVVAVESSVWAQGLPRPMNFEVALEVDAQIRAGGAVPAVIYVAGGKLHFGLTRAELERLCSRPGRVAKVGVGDLPGMLAGGGAGATTVSASLVGAELAGIEVLATGGVGGVHRNWSQRPDISADLGQLARTRCLTVCSGVKSVIDIPATLEILESLAIPLALYRTDDFPRFYTQGLPIEIGFRVDSPEEAARAHRASVEILGRGLMVAQPVPPEHAIPLEEVEGWLREGLRRAETERSTGKALTPFLLDHLARASGGRSLEANRSLLQYNAHLAARIAVAMVDTSS
ncbi:MAG: pseudouridine-5'-phosphate glycosidase [Armatimonadetes bacterium]|nr:pseudouridine-5'-phosphate glycosidase [Armatimonadota bacterium]